MSPKARIFWTTFVIALALDVATKAWVVATIHYGDYITVIDGFFLLTHVRNPGAAFSLLADAEPVFRRVFFIVASSLAVVLILSFYRNLAPGERLSALALGLIQGGAVGNLLDRIFRSGEVVDFLHFRLWQGYSWPDFNVADSVIVVGVLLLVLELFATEGEQREDSEPIPAENANPRGSGDAV